MNGCKSEAGPTWERVLRRADKAGIGGLRLGQGLLARASAVLVPNEVFKSSAMLRVAPWLEIIRRESRHHSERTGHQGTRLSRFPKDVASQSARRP